MNFESRTKVTDTENLLDPSMQFSVIQAGPTTVPELELGNCEQCGLPIQYGDVAVASPPASSGFLIHWTEFLADYAGGQWVEALSENWE